MVQWYIGEYQNVNHGQKLTYNQVLLNLQNGYNSTTGISLICQKHTIKALHTYVVLRNFETFSTKNLHLSLRNYAGQTLCIRWRQHKVWGPPPYA